MTNRKALVLGLIAASVLAAYGQVGYSDTISVNFFSNRTDFTAPGDQIWFIRLKRTWTHEVHRVSG